VLYQRLPVVEVRHEQIRLKDGGRLQGPLLAEHLVGAHDVIAVICTIGDALEMYSSKVSRNDTVQGLALDGAGSAAVEALANAFCAYSESQTRQVGEHSSIPLSPGMIGWPVEQGQPQMFKILDSSEIGVQLSSSMMMTPRKSLSFVIGLGERMDTSARTCDFCSLKETCRYQDHYA
jgi:hypothetical protein